MTECRRCGTCCLPGLALVHDRDIKRWKSEGRDDILRVLEKYHPVWAGDHIISSTGGETAHRCPFLIVDGDVTGCSIYNTRPEVCRMFMPGSSEICPLWNGGSV